MASQREPYLTAFPDAINQYVEFNSWYRQTGSRPDEVHEDVWARYEAVAPLVRLNLGVATAYVTPDASSDLLTTDFLAAANGFRSTNDPMWLVAEALAARGLINHDIESMAARFVSAVTASPGSNRDELRGLVPSGDVSLLFALILLRAGGVPPPFYADKRAGGVDLSTVIGGVRTDDQASERRTQHLRQMARAFNQAGWLASVRGLILQTIRMSMVDTEDTEVVRWMVAAEPPFDPLVIATCLAAARTSGAEWEIPNEFVNKLRAAGRGKSARHERPTERAFLIYCDAVAQLLTPIHGSQNSLLT